jgi:hypothetical protein
MRPMRVAGVGARERRTGESKWSGQKGVKQEDVKRRTRDSNEVGRSSVRSAGVTNDVGGETTSNDEDRLLSDETKVVHGIDKGLLQNRKGEQKARRQSTRSAETRMQIMMR